MGGKGQRRREKNFKAAHGGYSRLPSPPKPNEIDALPSKLRRLIDFASPPTTKGKLSADPESKKNTNKDHLVTAEKKAKPKDDSSSKIPRPENTNEGKLNNSKHKDVNEETIHGDTSDKKKGKRKRKQVKDLRFDTTQELDTYGSKKRERKKKFSEAKKKKHKKAKTEEGPQFPGREEIKFGDVVDAPPKLLSVPKGVKNVQAASHERLRLQAVEAYRNRKGWGSRPGIHPPPTVLDPSV